MCQKGCSYATLKSFMLHKSLSQNAFCLYLHNSSDCEVNAKCYWPWEDLIEMMVCDRQSKICMIIDVKIV